MIKNYLTKEINHEPTSPSRKTIEFLLNYSKSLRFIKLKNNIDQAEVTLN